jgi:hypothetical protein
MLILFISLRLFIAIPSSYEQSSRADRRHPIRDRNVFVVQLAMFNCPCAWWRHIMGYFGPNRTMNADPAGVIWMYSDENPDSAVGPQLT